MGFLGHRPTVTPNLDALAAESVVFEDAYTAVPLTLPSHSSLMTGLYPLSHHLRDNSISALPKEATRSPRCCTSRLAHARDRRRVRARSLFGLDQGFDRYDAVPRRFARGASTSAERPADEVIDGARAQDVSSRTTRRASRAPHAAAVLRLATPLRPPLPLRPGAPATSSARRLDAARERRALRRRGALRRPQLGRLLDVRASATAGRTSRSSSRPTTASRSATASSRRTAASSTTPPCACRCSSRPPVAPRTQPRPVSLVDVMPTLLEPFGLDGATCASTA